MLLWKLIGRRGLLSNNVALHGCIQIMITFPSGYVTELGGPYVRGRNPGSIKKLGSQGVFVRNSEPFLLHSLNNCVLISGKMKKVKMW
jgi:hypothetical protein